MDYQPTFVRSHYQTTFVTCPYCDYEDEDGFELFKDGGESAENNCSRCGKDYKVRQIVDVCYTTCTMEEPADGTRTLDKPTTEEV